MSQSWVFEPLSKQHDRSEFNSGVPILDTYLKRYAGQEQRRHVSTPYVLTQEGDSRVWGYYTLAAASVELDALPTNLAK